MKISDLICPNPDDVNDGEIDVMFTCSASVIAPSGVDPDFAWKISGDDKLGEMQNRYVIGLLNQHTNLGRTLYN